MGTISTTCEGSTRPAMKTYSMSKEETCMSNFDTPHMFVYVRVSFRCSFFLTLFLSCGSRHTWRYTPDPPGWLITIIFFFLFACACYIAYEYHKYARAMALERYAIKRIRRKFKGMMAEGGDRDAKAMHKKAQKGKSKKKKKKKKKKGKTSRALRNLLSL
mmetsp:Transcript_17302/g.22466  ORF Transcript_17302/g.22466 Transcript_17302/m.22466 type:complete len:160 (+) Transcript_17302:2875-3354(+)